MPLDAQVKLLRALQDGESGGNGVYLYGVGGGFPDQTFQSTNYWVDVVFRESVGPDVTPPVVVGQSPAPGAVDVPAGTTVTATFSEDLDAATVNGATVELRDGGKLDSAREAAEQALRIAPTDLEVRQLIDDLGRPPNRVAGKSARAPAVKSETDRRRPAGRNLQP